MDPFDIKPLLLLSLITKVAAFDCYNDDEALSRAAREDVSAYFVSGQNNFLRRSFIVDARRCDDVNYRRALSIWASTAHSILEEEHVQLNRSRRSPSTQLLDSVAFGNLDAEWRESVTPCASYISRGIINKDKIETDACLLCQEQFKPSMPTELYRLIFHTTFLEQMKNSARQESSFADFVHQQLEMLARDTSRCYRMYLDCKACSHEEPENSYVFKSIYDKLRTVEVGLRSDIFEFAGALVKNLLQHSCLHNNARQCAEEIFDALRRKYGPASNISGYDWFVIVTRAKDQPVFTETRRKPKHFITARHHDLSVLAYGVARSRCSYSDHMEFDGKLLEKSYRAHSSGWIQLELKSRLLALTMQHLKLSNIDQPAALVSLYDSTFTALEPSSNSSRFHHIFHVDGLIAAAFRC